MIEEAARDRLLHFQPQEAPVLSLYVTFRREMGFHGMKALLHSILQPVQELADSHALSRSGRVPLRADLERIHQIVEPLDLAWQGEEKELNRRVRHGRQDELPEQRKAFLGRTFALCACHHAGLYEQCELRRPVPDRAEVDPTPYLRPLLAVMEETHDGVVAVIDARTPGSLPTLTAHCTQRTRCTKRCWTWCTMYSWATSHTGARSRTTACKRGHRRVVPMQWAPPPADIEHDLMSREVDDLRPRQGSAHAASMKGLIVDLKQARAIAFAVPIPPSPRLSPTGRSEAHAPGNPGGRSLTPPAAPVQLQLSLRYTTTCHKPALAGRLCLPTFPDRQCPHSGGRPAHEPLLLHTS